MSVDSAEHGGRLLASSWWRPGMTLNILWCTKQSPTTKSSMAPMSTVPRLGSPVTDKPVHVNQGWITKLTEGIWDLFCESWGTMKDLNTWFLIILRGILLLWLNLGICLVILCLTWSENCAYCELHLLVLQRLKKHDCGKFAKSLKIKRKHVLIFSSSPVTIHILKICVFILLDSPKQGQAWTSILMNVKHYCRSTEHILGHHAVSIRNKKLAHPE